MKPNDLSQIAWLSAAAAVSGSAILGALWLEHAAGYLPCKLCLEQREPYYAGLAVIALALVWSGKTGRTARFYGVMLALVATAVFVKSAYLGIHHAGVEWKLWEGPGDCGPATALSGSYDAASLLEQIQNTVPVSCTEPALRIIGLSLAGWNAVASLAVAALCMAAALAASRESRRGG